MKRLAWIMVLAGSLTIALVPFLFYKQVTGEFFPTTPPQLEQDTTYYLILGKEFLDGHPALGNPYIKEYADAFFPGMHLAMKTAMLPGLLGFDIRMIYGINIVLYGLIAGITLFMLCKQIAPRYAYLPAFVALLGLATLHNNLLRPGMQTILPVFIVSMSALLWVLQNPHKPLRYFALGTCCAVSLYIYPYSWMTMFTATGFLILRTLYQKDTKALTLQFLMVCGVAVVCIPQIQSILALFYDEMTHDLNVRIGLTETHTVLPLTWWNMKYVIVGILSLLFVALKRKLSAAETMILFVGSALLVGSISNVVTGKQMDFSTHFYRFGLPWVTAAIMALVYSLHTEKDRVLRGILGVCLTLLVLSSINRACIRANAFEYLFRKTDIQATYNNLQAYQSVFAFLNQDTSSEEVVLTTPDLSTYIPLYTQHYVMYHPMALLNTISNEELLKRFITFYNTKADEEYLRTNLVYVAGIGPKEEANYANVHGGSATYLDYAAPDLLQKALSLRQDVLNDYDEYVHTFNVRYIVVDAQSEYQPRLPRKKTTVFSNERFTIYKIPRE